MIYLLYYIKSCFTIETAHNLQQKSKKGLDAYKQFNFVDCNLQEFKPLKYYK